MEVTASLQGGQRTHNTVYLFMPYINLVVAQATLVLSDLHSPQYWSKLNFHMNNSIFALLSFQNAFGTKHAVANLTLLYVTVRSAIHSTSIK